MKNYKELLSELPSKSVVFTCGRFNPPNVGHELEIKVVRKLASQRKADHFIFVSSVQDAKKNPLEISKKMQYLGSLFPNTKFVHKEIDTIGSVLKKYKSVTLVTPTDNVEYYKKALKKVGITDVEIVKAGDTCPDEDDKLLKLASKGEFVSFKNSLPTTVRELDGKRLMNDIRIGLNLEPIREQINLVKDDLREQYFRGEIFNEGDIVESDNTVYKIIKRGSNHLLLQNEAGLKVSKWIQDVQLTEREFMLDEKLLQEADAAAATGLATGNKEAKKAQADTEKMKLALDQAKEKEDLAKQQERERQNLKNIPEECGCKDSPVVDKSKKYNIAKSIMSLSDFRKSTGQMTKDETEIADKVKDGLVGNSHLHTDHSMRHRKVKYHLGEGNGYDDNRTGFAKKPREDDEYHNEPKPKFKAKSLLDRPHTVHIDGKPWKKFDNGHQAQAAAKTLRAKGKKANAIAHFREEVVNEVNKHSTLGRILRGHELKKKVDSSFEKIGDAQKKGVDGSKAFRDHERYANLERPGTWTKVKEETDEQQATRTAQLKRFKDQAKESKLTEAQVDEAVKTKVKTVNVDKVHTAGQEPHEEKFETVKEEAVTEGYFVHREKDTKLHFNTVAQLRQSKTPSHLKVTDHKHNHLGTVADVLRNQTLYKTEETEFDDIDDNELASLVEADMDALTEDDFFEAYDDEELAIIDDETGEEIEAVDSVAEEALMEVLSRVERIRAKARMRRSQTKRERREKVALRQLSTPQVANKRARRMAVSALKKRLLRGQNASKISVGEKERVERFIQQRRKVVDRLAARMVSRVKQVEKARMSHKKYTKPAGI
jgi:hypothetical protein